MTGGFVLPIRVRPSSMRGKGSGSSNQALIEPARAEVWPTGDPDIMTSNSFEALPLAAPIQRALADRQYTTPSPI